MPNPNLPINYRKNTYIGARYVPIFANTPGSEWDNSIQYEPLTIVLHEGNSYTSKTFVPVGVDITNTIYWALTGNFNAQLANLTVKYNEILKTIQKLEFADIPSVLNYETVFYKTSKHYYNFASIESAIYGSFQGFTYADGVFYGIMIPIEYYYNFNTISNLAVIVKFDTNFNVISSSSPITLYHANTMDYYDGFLYINANSEGTQIVNKIIKVNAATLTQDSVINIDIPANFAWIEAGFLFTGTRSHIEKRNLNGVLIDSTKLNVNNPIWYTIKPFRDGYIATTNEYNNIFILDKKFNVKKVCEIYGNYFTNGELKDVAVIDNDVYIPHNGRWYYRSGEAECSEVYAKILHFNLQHNIDQLDNVAYSTPGQAYVDTSKNTTPIQNGLPATPYSTIMQAIQNGASYIFLMNSDGLVISGSDLNIEINSALKSNIIHFVNVINSSISGSNFTINDTVIKQSIRGSKIQIGNFIDNGNIDSYYNNIVSDAPLNIIEKSLSAISRPFNVTNNNQKWTIQANSNVVQTELTALPNTGITIINFGITGNGNSTSCTVCAVNGEWNQYFEAYIKSTTYIKFRGYLNITINNGELKAVVNNPEINDRVETINVTRLLICHLI